MSQECLDHESVDQRLVLSYACPESLCYFDVEQAPQVRGFFERTRWPCLNSYLLLEQTTVLRFEAMWHSH
eukprot:2542437-Amphidinium_carterae.1